MKATTSIGYIKEYGTLSTSALFNRPAALVDEVIAPNLGAAVFRRFRFVDVVAQM